QGSHDNDVVIEQQGVSSLRRLYKQRIRWSQGGWQCVPLLRTSHRVRCRVPGRVDMFWYLVTPIVQTLITLALLGAVVFTGLGHVDVWMGGLATLVIFVSLAFLPGLFGMLSMGTGWTRVVMAFVLIIPYTLYSWLVMPVVFIALIRQLSGKT